MPSQLVLKDSSKKKNGKGMTLQILKAREKIGSKKTFKKGRLRKNRIIQNLDDDIDAKTVKNLNIQQ